MSAPPSDLNAIFAAALAAVDPEPAVRDQLDGVRALYHREGHGRLIVTGFGKAAFAMARAVRRGLPDLIADGCIVTKDGQRVPEVSLDPIRVREADCPDLRCVRQGWIALSGEVIACVPHGLLITLEGGRGGVDAVSQ